MPFPPLSWQTYDVDFSNAVVKDGKKLRMLELPQVEWNCYPRPIEICATGGSRPDVEGTAGSIKLRTR